MRVSLNKSLKKWIEYIHFENGYFEPNPNSKLKSIFIRYP